MNVNPTYIALLRGINVSGQKIIRIEELKKMLEYLGFENVKSYIQSGNFVFNSKISNQEKIIKLIGNKIKEMFLFDVSVILRTHNDLLKILKNNPFVTNKPPERLYVAFLSDAVDKSCGKLLIPYKSKDEEFHIAENEIYLYYADGAGRTKLSNNIIETKLGVKATTRNWNTVNKLYELSHEPVNKEN